MFRWLFALTRSRVVAAHRRIIDGGACVSLCLHGQIVTCLLCTSRGAERINGCIDTASSQSNAGSYGTGPSCRSVACVFAAVLRGIATSTKPTHLSNSFLSRENGTVPKHKKDNQKD